MQKEANEALTAQQYADAKVLSANTDLKQLKKELKQVASKLKGVHSLRVAEQAQEDDKQTSNTVVASLMYFETVHATYQPIFMQPTLLRQHAIQYLTQDLVLNRYMYRTRLQRDGQ